MSKIKVSAAFMFNTVMSYTPSLLIETREGTANSRTLAPTNDSADCRSISKTATISKSEQNQFL